MVTGLAWTPAGGDLLFIETTKMKGSGKVMVTGQLGSVMEESVEAAYSYVRSKADVLGIDPEVFETVDVHIHFPEGAIPKDGPSAGRGGDGSSDFALYRPAGLSRHRHDR